MINKIVLQGTAGCNLDCTYCYVPDRAHIRLMPIAVVQEVARFAEEQGATIQVIWHAGEPLACGIEAFRKLLAPFEQGRLKGIVRHAVQTNGTLIDREWCQLFHRYQISVGISVDGPADLTHNRVNWGGRAAYEAITRGIAHLRVANIPFNAIAVVSDAGLSRAQDLYNYFQAVGCTSVGFNILEREGTCTEGQPDDERVGAFWSALFDAWRANPSLEVREIRQVLEWMKAVIDEGTVDVPLDLFPSVRWNGDVTLLSPEFVGMQQTGGSFVIGNVLEQPLATLLAEGQRVQYVQDFSAGVTTCRDTCDYFSFCHGGQASNKYFETGRLDVTETAHCRNSRIRLAEAVLASL